MYWSTWEGLKAFNLLERPIVWVFDIENTNNSALKLWKANSLESILQPSFVDNMSKATEQECLEEYLIQFHKGECIHDQ